MKMKKLALLAAAIASAALTAATYDDLASVRRVDDATNGGFWDATGHGVVSVAEATAAVGNAVSSDSGTKETCLATEGVDAISLTWDCSGGSRLWTDPVGMVIIVL